MYVHTVFEPQTRILYFLLLPTLLTVPSLTSLFRQDVDSCGNADPNCRKTEDTPDYPHSWWTFPNTGSGGCQSDMLWWRPLVAQPYSGKFTRAFLLTPRGFEMAAKMEALRVEWVSVCQITQYFRLCIYYISFTATHKFSIEAPNVTIDIFHVCHFIGICIKLMITTWINKKCQRSCRWDDRLC